MSLIGLFVSHEEKKVLQHRLKFDLNTKKLWQELHYPYGNYTSFFRHLILLEKYWRSGDLVLSPTASQKSSVYIRSVHNRIEAYEGKHKRSDADLSASTRPDMNIPPAPPLVHVPGGSPTVVEVTPPKAKQVSMLQNVFPSLLTMRPNKLECLYLAITFQSSLTFAGNTRSVPKKEVSERCSNWVGSGLALKF
jgi:hypothetical protein